MTLKSRRHPRALFTVRARDLSLALGRKTRIMGIVNVTPDSFSRDGQMTSAGDSTQRAVNHARRLIRQGADIIDVGGESTRPGAARVPAEEEIRRIIPVIRRLARDGKIPLSADTYKSVTAQHALDAGAGIINNIKGIRAEKGLLKMVRNYGAALVLMHIRGTPRTMQKHLDGSAGSAVLREIIDSLKNSIEICLECGIKSDRIIIDPGFGFGKTFAQNLLILNRLGELGQLGYPVMIGTSRKSFIGKILNKDVDGRLMGTAATVTAGILNGAHIVRVHDVKAVTEAARVTDAIINERYFEEDA